MGRRGHGVSLSSEIRRGLPRPERIRVRVAERRLRVRRGSVARPSLPRSPRLLRCRRPVGRRSLRRHRRNRGRRVPRRPRGRLRVRRQPHRRPRVRRRALRPLAPLPRRARVRHRRESSPGLRYDAGRRRRPLRKARRICLLRRTERDAPVSRNLPRRVVVVPGPRRLPLRPRSAPRRLRRRRGRPGRPVRSRRSRGLRGRGQVRARMRGRGRRRRRQRPADVCPKERVSSNRLPCRRDKALLRIDFSDKEVAAITQIRHTEMDVSRDCRAA